MDYNFPIKPYFFVIQKLLSFFCKSFKSFFDRLLVSHKLFIRNTSGIKHLILVFCSKISENRYFREFLRKCQKLKSRENIIILYRDIFFLLRQMDTRLHAKTQQKPPSIFEKKAKKTWTIPFGSHNSISWFREYRRTLIVRPE